MNEQIELELADRLCLTEYVLPYHWTSYFASGDFSGFSDEEEQEINDWLEHIKPGHCVNMTEKWSEGYEEFGRNEANNLMGETAVFIFQR